MERAADLVHDQRGERFALDLLRDDDDRLAALGDHLEDRQQVLHRADLLFVDQDQRIFQHRFHAVRVGDEIRRKVAAVELHALDDLELGVEALGLLDRDHAFLTDLLHGLGDDVADGRVVVGGDRADLGDLLRVLRRLGELLQLFDDHQDRLVDAALERHRVVTGGHHAGALGEDRARQHGRGGGAVAGDVRGLGRDLLHHLRAHVLELVLELDLLGDRDAVLGHRGSPPRFLDDDVAPLGAEGDGHRVGQRLDPAQNLVAGFGTELDDFRSHANLTSNVVMS